MLVVLGTYKHDHTLGKSIDKISLSKHGDGNRGVLHNDLCHMRASFLPGSFLVVSVKPGSCTGCA